MDLIRRITGLTPGEYFRKAIGDPLGLRAWIGLPDLLTIELPGAGAVASADGLAQLFAAALTGPNPLLSPTTITNAAEEVSSGKGYLGSDVGARWGSGSCSTRRSVRCSANAVSVMTAPAVSSRSATTSTASVSRTSATA